MKSTTTLQNEAEALVEYEKELTVKEILKEHIFRIQETAAGIEEAKERHEDAKKKYEEILKNNNLLLKLCLKKVVTQQIKSKD
jgi:hypothetical protein